MKENKKLYKKYLKECSNEDSDLETMNVFSGFCVGYKIAIKETEKKMKKLDKLSDKYARMIELMSDGMSYDKAKEEV